MQVIDGIRVAMARMVEEEQMGDWADDKARAWWAEARRHHYVAPGVPPDLAALLRQVATDAQEEQRKEIRSHIKHMMVCGPECPAHIGGTCDLIGRQS